MKQILDPIEVKEERGRPRLIRWAGRVYHVRALLDVWIYQSRWWGAEERRVYFRLETSRGIVEVWRSGDGWVLAGVLD